jgi:hypothetical protein
MNKIYFCSWCKKIHYDDDFLEEDGDIEINLLNWKKFVKSVDEVDKRLLEDLE